MLQLSNLIAHGASDAWFFIPAAILLGALHGLEPVDSKIRMMAFMVAIRGTVRQAIVLGIASMISRTMAVWAVALGGLYVYGVPDADAVGPFFQLLSALVVVGVALWMIARAYTDRKAARAAAGYFRSGYRGLYRGHDKIREIVSGHGTVRLEIFEQGTSPRWRFNTLFGNQWPAEGVSVLTERRDGSKQAFSFVQREGFLESDDVIPRPYDFIARVKLYHGDHAHDYDVSFADGQNGTRSQREWLHLEANDFQDPRELAQSNDIRRRLADRTATTWK